MKIRIGHHRDPTTKRGHRRKRGTDSFKPLGPGGRIAGMFFFGLFLTAGLFFALSMLGELTDQAASKNWPMIHGDLEEAGIRVDQASNDPFTLSAVYHYTVDGTAYKGTTVQRDRPAYDEYRKAQKILDRIPTQTALKVYYNPAQPGESTLLHASNWRALMLLLPLVFIIIGGGGMVAVFFLNMGTGDDAHRSISEKASGKKQAGGVFFLIFAAAGVGFMTIFVQPILHTLTSDNWPKTPCTIIYSALRSYSSDDGTTYKADILFEYQFGGRTYRSNRVKFMGGSSSGSMGKRKVLNAYPKGSTRVCFVNSSDPTLAVLDRSASPIYFFALIPLVFIVIGVGGFIKWIWNHHAPERPRPHNRRPPHPHQQSSILTATGEVELKSKEHRIVKFLFLLVFALFWNGMVFGFLVREVVESWQGGKGDWFLTLFSIPFVAAGLGVAIGAIVTFLKFFNPVLHLYVSHPTMVPGKDLAIRWQMRGGLKPVEELSLKFIGEEVTTYRRGTNTCTDHHTFYEDILVEGDRFQDVDRGTATLTLPSSAMHSFDQPNNNIVWSLKAHGTITFWPDVTIDYEVPVTASEGSS